MLAQSKFGKTFIRPFSGHKLAAGAWSAATKAKGSPCCYKYPHTPFRKKKKKKKRRQFRAFLEQILSLFLSKFSPKYIFDFSLLSTIMMQCSCTLFPLLDLKTLDLWFKGCRCSFLATIYTKKLHLHPLLYVCSQHVYLLSMVYLCFILLPSMFYSLFSMSPFFFTMFYRFDDVDLAFLG